MPTLALYILGAAGLDDDDPPPSPAPPSKGAPSTLWIDVGLESAIDVHLRNACVLQTDVAFLCLGSLRSVDCTTNFAGPRSTSTKAALPAEVPAGSREIADGKYA